MFLLCFLEGGDKKKFLGEVHSAKIIPEEGVELNSPQQHAKNLLKLEGKEC